MFWCLVLLAILATNSALNLPGVPVSFTGNDEIISAISNDIAQKFATEYLAYKRTGVESAALRQLASQLAASHSKKDIFIESTAELDQRDQFFLCTTCRATTNVIARLFRSPDGELNGPNAEEQAKKVTLEICGYLDIQTEEVCAGLFDLNWPYVQYIMQNSVSDSRSFCGTLPISMCQVQQEEFDWSVKVDSTGPAVTEHKSGIPTKSESDLKVLQITDIHYDPEYEPGSLADCPEVLCCQRRSAGNIAADKQAGYWGDYRECDSPLHLIENAIEHINEEHKQIDYIYQTGDIVPHIVWATTKEGNIRMLTEMNNLLATKFPNIPIYSSVGNHEAHPFNVFGTGNVPEELDIKWLYEHLYTMWSKWLPADTKETILKGGYYTVSPKQGFRIISLNNNDCYLFNWWVFYDGSTGREQLQWLHDTLLAAEKNGEYVHILMHIPTGNSDCWTVWAREFNRIVERFSPIVGAIFSGHTHKDEMNVHYTEKGHAVAVNWNGGSLTTYTYKNPNYRIYDVEAESMQVVDHESWIFNVTAANLHKNSQKPVWYKSYQFSEDFTTDLSPAGLDAWLDRLAEKPSLLRKYWAHKMTLADPRLQEGCDHKCLRDTICRLATTVYDQKERCNELKLKLQESLDNGAEVEEEEEGNEGDGATAITAYSAATLIALYYIANHLFHF